MFKTSIKLFLLLLVTGSMMTACKKDDDKAKVSVQLTDDPFPVQFLAEANVEITKIELKNDQDDYVVVFEGHKTTNVANYTNGSTAEVTVKTVPNGTYKGVRVTVGNVSVKMTDNTVFEFNAAAGSQSEVDIEPALQVSDGQVGDLLLDLDLADSFEFSGSFMGGWITSIAQITGIDDFDADFRAVALNKTGTVSGTVKDANDEPVAYADVKIKYDYNGDGLDDDVTTHTEADGHFKIIGLPQGVYKLKVETENNGDIEIDNVNVSVQHNTNVNVVVQ